MKRSLGGRLPQLRVFGPIFRLKLSRMLHLRTLFSNSLKRLIKQRLRLSKKIQLIRILQKVISQIRLILMKLKKTIMSKKIMMTQTLQKLLSQMTIKLLKLK